MQNFSCSLLSSRLDRVWSSRLDRVWSCSSVTVQQLMHTAVHVMSLRSMSFLLLLALLFHVGNSAVIGGGLPVSSLQEANSVQSPRAKSKEAYVTLLYGGFLLGARVLGQSIRETGTQKDLVALCTEAVSEETKEVLRSDGWIVREVGTIENPYGEAGSHFFGVYSKLHVWNMTDYERVIILDSDILVLSNIDHLFDCGTFCASFREAEFFNSGVLVVEPSSAVFRDMVKKVPLFPSYDGGEQGFLSVYFKDLIYAPFFNWSNSTRQHQPMRMSSGFNADVMMHYMDDGWRLPKAELYVIHYTMGPAKPKPWVWWAGYLFNLNQLWTDVRLRLPAYDEHPGPFHNLIFWAPYPALVVFYVLLCSIKWNFQSASLHAMKLGFTSVNKYSYFFPLTFLLFSYYLAYNVVPTTILPSHGEYVFWLWSNFFLHIFMGLYCYLCHVARNRHDNQHLCALQKTMWSLLLYLVFTVSYILLRVVPLVMTLFSQRIKYVVALSVIHIVVSVVAGQRVISVWNNAKGVI